MPPKKTRTTEQRAAPFRGWNATALYSTDNGRTLCGKHLGSSALMTGRDISGQKIHRYTAADLAYFEAEFGALAGCETCRAIAMSEARRALEPQA